MLKGETPSATHCVATGRAPYDDKNSISDEAILKLKSLKNRNKGGRRPKTETKKLL